MKISLGLNLSNKQLNQPPEPNIVGAVSSAVAGLPHSLAVHSLAYFHRKTRMVHPFSAYSTFCHRLARFVVLPVFDLFIGAKAEYSTGLKSLFQKCRHPRIFERDSMW
jgi:hypothetical protein